MGGGGIHYNVIPPGAIESWARISGNHPTQWELSILHQMDVAFVMAKSGGNKKDGKQYQGVGDYCQGKEIDKCRAAFGALLKRVCATCPD